MTILHAQLGNKRRALGCAHPDGSVTLAAKENSRRNVLENRQHVKQYTGSHDIKRRALARVVMGVGKEQDRSVGWIPLVLALLELWEKHVCQQEVAKVVHSHRQLIALHTEAGLLVYRQVHCGVAHKCI